MGLSVCLSVNAHNRTTSACTIRDIDARSERPNGCDSHPDSGRRQTSRLLISNSTDERSDCERCYHARCALLRSVGLRSARGGRRGGTGGGTGRGTVGGARCGWDGRNLGGHVAHALPLLTGECTFLQGLKH